MSTVKQIAANLEAAIRDNPLVAVLIIIAIALALLIFGGLLLDFCIEKRRARQKAKAVERLHKHLASLPSVKS